MNAHSGAAMPPQAIKASTSVAMILCHPPQEVSFHHQTQAAAIALMMISNALPAKCWCKQSQELDHNDNVVRSPHVRLQDYEEFTSFTHSHGPAHNPHKVVSA